MGTCCIAHLSSIGLVAVGVVVVGFGVGVAVGVCVLVGVAVGVGVEVGVAVGVGEGAAQPTKITRDVNRMAIKIIKCLFIERSSIFLNLAFVPVIIMFSDTSPPEPLCSKEYKQIIIYQVSI